MRHIIVILPIDIYIYADTVEVAASKKPNGKKPKNKLKAGTPNKKFILTPEISELREKIYSWVLDYGFSLYRIPEPGGSNRNGGCSTYREFGWETDDAIVKLVVNLRISDHSAKPSLARMRKNTLSDMSKRIPDSAIPEFSDVYRTTHDWGYMVYVGGDTEYNKGIAYRNGEDTTLPDRQLKQAIRNRLDTLMSRVQL